MKITTAQSINLQEWEYLSGLTKAMQAKPTSPDSVTSQMDFEGVPTRRQKLFKHMVHIDIEPWFEKDGQGFGTKLPFNMVDNQFFILKYRGRYLFANNEGYDYPKYILALLNYSE
jgi:hypothetical protein